MGLQNNRAKTCKLLLSSLLLLSCTDFSVSDDCADQESASCLDAVKGAFNDLNHFWFGNWYSTNCLDGAVQRDVLWCSSAAQVVPPTTLQQLINGVDGADIDRFLAVEYTSKAGNYSGCDTTYTRDTEVTFELNPSLSDAYPAWDARDRPAMSWMTKDEQVKYTIVYLDVGAGVVHGLWSNIEGGSLPGGDSDLLNGDVVWAHRGPKNPFYERPFLYVFLLFKQPSMEDINIDASGLGDIFTLQSTLSTFKSTYGLTGPVAANWIHVEGDIYATNFMLESNVFSNCPSFINRALTEAPHSDRRFIPGNTDMSVFIHVTIFTPEIDYTVCSMNETSEATVFTLDPIANPLEQGAVARETDGTQSITFEKEAFLAFPDASSFAGELYTALCVDPDVGRPEAGTQDHPILHMLVTNIENGDFESGDALMPYRGPRPPSGQHVYYFLLYKQRNAEELTFNFTEVRNEYIESETCERCLFDVNRFTYDKHLELVGATWMTVQHDSWVKYSYIESGRDESEFCSDPTDGASNLTVWFSAMLLQWLILFFCTF